MSNDAGEPPSWLKNLLNHAADALFKESIKLLLSHGAKGVLRLLGWLVIPAVVGSGAPAIMQSLWPPPPAGIDMDAKYLKDRPPTAAPSKAETGSIVGHPGSTSPVEQPRRTYAPPAPRAAPKNKQPPEKTPLQRMFPLLFDRG